MKKIFLASMCARNLWTGTVNHYAMLVPNARSTAEAEGLALQRLRKECPSQGGWANYDTSISDCTEFIKELMEEQTDEL